jgi:hypothetical protein
MKKIIYFLLPIISLFHCGEDFNSQNYFPLDENYMWTFSGPLRGIKVTLKESVARGEKFTVVYSDTLGAPSWEEEYVKKNNRIYLKSYKSFSKFIPTATFEPPIPITPISENRSEIEVFESTVTHYDTAVASFKILVENVIEEIETIEAPAGQFDQCIRMKVTISYEDPPPLPLFAETSYWWFAKGIGPVKYSTATDEGIIQNASLGTRSYPVN